MPHQKHTLKALFPSQYFITYLKCSSRRVSNHQSRPIIIMARSLLSLLLLLETSVAFPFVANQAGVDASLFKNVKRQQTSNGPGSAAQCPYNPDHVPAVGISSKYPYNGATGGLPGNIGGGFQVPAPGDTAHAFVAPGPNDIRGEFPWVELIRLPPVANIDKARAPA